MKIFYGKKFSEHENEWNQFKELLHLIESEYGNNDNDPVYLLANVGTARSQIDVLLLLTNGIIILELKSYSGMIEGGQKGDWKVGTSSKVVDLHKNLFIQLATQRKDLFELLGNLKTLRNRIPKERMKRIQAWAYFQSPSTYDKKGIDKKNWIWFDVVNKDSVIEKLRHFSKPGYNLKEEDKKAIVIHLDLKEYNELKGKGSGGFASSTEILELIPGHERSTSLENTLNDFFSDHDFCPEVKSLIERAAKNVFEGRLEEAVPITERAVEISTAESRGDHPDTLVLKSYLSNLFLKMGRFNESEKIYEEVLDIKKRQFPSGDPEIVITLNDLSNLYCSKGDFLGAQNYSEEAISVLERFSGPEDLSLAETLTNLGKIYFSNKKFSEAEAAFNRALEIRVNILGSEDFLVSDSLIDMSEFYFKMGKYDRSTQFCKRALEIRIADAGKEDSIVAWTFDFLGDILLSNNEKMKAKLAYEKAQKIWTNTLGLHHENTHQVSAKLKDINI